MKRLEEYLSNATSDFSDGTNGDPSAPGRANGDTGTTVGVPDYKYNERLKNRHEKLLALRQRRDPDGIEKPLDYSAIMKQIIKRSGESNLKEQRLSAEEKAILRGQTKRRRRPRFEQQEIDGIIAHVLEDAGP